MKPPSFFPSTYSIRKQKQKRIHVRQKGNLSNDEKENYFMCHNNRIIFWGFLHLKVFKNTRNNILENNGMNGKATILMIYLYMRVKWMTFFSLYCRKHF